jgi:predicted O-methyltransferase YrrM
MPRSTTALDGSVDRYLDMHSPEHPVLADLRRATEPLPLARMQIAPSQGAFIAWLVHTLGAKRTIEVGVFTGTSSLITALALPKDGKILACDISEEWTNVARAHYEKAGVSHKIDLVLRPAAETLKERILAGESNQYDFAFIDADKESYQTYYELCLRLIRRGGVIMLDNMLWGGSVADKSKQSESTRALRELNRRMAEDSRVITSLVPVGDGLMLATKK